MIILFFPFDSTIFFRNKKDLRSTEYIYYPPGMKNHKRVELRSSVKGAARIRCLRFLPLLLLGMLLSTGCVKQQQAQYHAEAPKPNVTKVEQSPDVIEAARSNIGIPYRYGGNSPQTGFDCSGLICWAYGQIGIQLPRSARDQFFFGEKIERKDLQPGDIVLFKGTNSRSGWHAGLYSGNNMFVHSPSTGKTVTETSLDTKYYAKHYAGARRIPRDGSATAMMAEYMEQQKVLYAASKSKKSSKQSTAVASSKKKGGKTVAASSGKKKTTVAASSANAKATANAAPAKKNTQTVAQKKGGDKPLQTAAANRGSSATKKADAVVNRLQSEKKVASVKNGRSSASSNQNKTASGAKKGS